MCCQSQEQAEAALARLTSLLAGLGLEPKTAKTRIVHLAVGGEGFDFLGVRHEGTTRLDYSGELGTDFAAAGQWWARRVTAAWEAAVWSSFTSIRTEAERRARPGTANP